MRTEPIFRDDAYAAAAEATVIGLEPVAAQPGAEPVPSVILDRTVFYAAGGGQPGDSGRLIWDGGAAEVVTAVKAGPEGLAIAHVPAPGASAPPVGAAVRAEIDWARRHRHMRVHTALHLLSVAIPLPVTGGQIGAEKGRLDFDMPEAPADKEALAARLAELIAADHPVSAEWITDAELDANPGLVKTMAVAPPRGDGRVRLVRIGRDDATVDLQPCGGTHVRSTAEIGTATLGKIEKKGRQNRRVTLVLA